jgi:hypothetical protein
MVAMTNDIIETTTEEITASTTARNAAMTGTMTNIMIVATAMETVTVTEEATDGTINPLDSIKRVTLGLLDIQAALF